MKYQSELIKEIIDTRGHDKSSLHYESECIETWIEENKGAYPKLTDYQSEWLNYINENPIGEFPYETITDVTNATIDNVVPFEYKSAILKGQTTDTIIDFTGSFTIQNAVKDFNFLFSPNLNKEYMLTLELTDVTPRNGESDYIAVRGVKEDGSYDELARVTQSYANGIYEIPCEFTKNYSKLRIAVSFKATIVNMKLRGDLISVKMPVLTTVGKNLFNGELENGAIVSSTGANTPSTDNVRSVGYIKVNPNASIVLSNDLNYSNNLIYEYDSNKDYIGRKMTNPFTTSTNCQYIRFRTDVNQPNLDVKYQIEYGTIATPYEPFKSNILTTPSDLELRGIGEMRDTLDCLTGEVVERIDVLNRSTIREPSIEKSSFAPTDTSIIAFAFNGSREDVEFLSPYLTYSTNKNLPNTWCRTTGVWCNIRLYKSEVSTIEGFKEWLDNHIVLFTKRKETVKTVDLTITNQDGETLNKLKPIEGTMHLSTSGENIRPLFSCEIPVEAITQNLASFIEEE